MLSYTDNKIEYDFAGCQQCGACEGVCPTGAIGIAIGKDALGRISVDHDKCIRCRKCVVVCPSRRFLSDGTLESKSYFAPLRSKSYTLAWNSNRNIRRMSSSGGAVKTIIIDALKSGEVDGVYTLHRLAEYPSAEGHYYSAEHLPSYTTLPNSVYCSIPACRGLKQVPKVKRLMIVGTSCQLYALERGLKGKYEELVKVCIFCKQQKSFGATRYFAHLAGARIPADRNISISYRGKGWPGEITIGKKSVSYSRGATLPFGRRLWSVPGCELCADPFGMECGADLTVMDPWNIRKDNELGESLAIAMTERGKELMEQCSDLESIPLDYQKAEKAMGLADVWRKRVCAAAYLGLTDSPRAKTAAKADKIQRRQLEALIDRLPGMPTLFYRSLNKLTPQLRDRILSPAPDFSGKRQEVAVITRHAPSNYGSLLQSIATLRALERIGCDARIIDYQRKDERGIRKVWTEACRKSSNPLKRVAYTAIRGPIEGIAQKRFDKMRREKLKLTHRCTTYERLQGVCADIYLTGSDQVWGPTVNGTVDGAYFLDFVKGGRKTAYAASFGKTDFTPEGIEYCRKAIGEYDKVAMREESAIELLQQWGVSNSVGQVLDPTLLLTRKEWEDEFELGEADPEETPYILVYQIHNDPRLSAYAKELSRRSGLPLLRVNPFLHQALRSGSFIFCPGADRFLELIRGAKLMVTDSFHGTCFAITFNTEFAEVLPNNNTGTRNLGLLHLLGLEGRIVRDFSDYSTIGNQTDYESVNRILERERRRSFGVLRDITGMS